MELKHQDGLFTYVYVFRRNLATEKWKKSRVSYQRKSIKHNKFEL